MVLRCAVKLEVLLRGNLVRDPRQLGLVLRQRRRQMALTQSQVGERAGLRAATVSSVENGDPGTKVSTLFALLVALDLEITARRRTTVELSTGPLQP